jgi:hypothetical protein
MDIVIRNNQRYKQYKDRLRRLCHLEKCNYPCLSNGYCKKHNIQESEQICNNCLKVEEKINFLDNKNCKKCNEKMERESIEFQPKIFLRNGIKYKQFKYSLRKLCKLDDCNAIASGDFCRKHKEQTIKDDEKQCHRCLTIKTLTEFQKDDKTYEHCINCRKYKQKSSLSIHNKRRKFLLQIKIDMGGRCINCGTEDLEILEFDHNSDDKINEVRRISNYQGMLDEAKKCSLLCCSCHMIKTKQTIQTEVIDKTNTKSSVLFSRKYRKNARNYIKEIKLNSNGCAECGWFDPNNLQVLQFDHINESDKKYNISRLASTGKNLKLIRSEIDKCRILCGNCHRKRTLRQFNYPILELIKNL